MKRLVVEGDPLDSAFGFRELIPGDEHTQAVWRANCRRCGAEWELLPDVEEAGALALDRGTRNSLLAHSNSHQQKHRMRRLS
jgi:hypothetical protein